MAAYPPPLRLAVVVTAAGSSERFGGGKKELLSLGDRSILDSSLSSFLGLPGLEALVITAPPGREAELRAALSQASLEALGRLGQGRFDIVAGGGSRRDSVRLGLEWLSLHVEAPLDDIIVLVHDGARPWASAALAARVAAAASQGGGAVPTLPLVDTPKELGSGGEVLAHPRRASFGGAQTPQGFRLASLLAAHRREAEEDPEGRRESTDDAELFHRHVGPVLSVQGEVENRKVTFAKDLATGRGAEAREGGVNDFRIGQGWDIHRLVAGRPLMLGGLRVPSELGEDAHSDGDVLLHAIIDALLGAAALGDIGSHFPPSDEAWRGADSRDLAKRAAALVREAGWRPGNLDCTVILERPRLGPYKAGMAASIAACLGMDAASVSVKAKTKEGLDAVGEGRAVEALAIVSLLPLGRVQPS